MFKNIGQLKVQWLIDNDAHGARFTVLTNVRHGTFEKARFDDWRSNQKLSSQGVGGSLDVHRNKSVFLKGGTATFLRSLVYRLVRSKREGMEDKVPHPGPFLSQRDPNGETQTIPTL